MAIGIDFGGAKHWTKEAAKLAPQITTINGTRYRRTVFGGSFRLYTPEMEKAEQQAELERQQNYQERMSYLNLSKEWYSMKEEDRIKIGNELFPLEKISELPTREEFQTLKGSSEMINDSPTYVPQSYFDYRKSKGGGELRSVVPKFTEIEKLTGAEKFREFAYKEQYFERNDQLNYFAGEVVRSNEEAQRKLRPEVIQEAKDQAIKQSEEMGMVGSARKTRKPLKKTPLQISSNPLENETVNIPT